MSTWLTLSDDEIEVLRQERDEIAHLYWETNIPVCEICEAYNIKGGHELVARVGWTLIEGLTCKECGSGIECVTRSDRDMRFGLTRYGGDQVAYQFPRLCRNCGLTALKARRAKQQADSEARDSARLRRLSDLRSMPYRDYLQTPEWQAARSAALKRANFKCQTCCAGGQLNVHHRTYVRRGEERNSDLIVLCAECHKLFHDNKKLAERGTGDK